MNELSPGKILHRLEELRRWQRLQEERLHQEQMLQRKQLADMQSKLCHSYSLSQRSHGEDPSADDDLHPEDGSKSSENLIRLSEEMDGVSVLDVSSESIPPTAPHGEIENVKTLPKLPESTISSIRDEVKSKSKTVLDEVPILPTAKDFKTLLEDKIKNNDAGIVVQKKNKNLAKKPAPPKPKTFLKKGQGMVRFNLTPDDIGLAKRAHWRRKEAVSDRLLVVSPLRLPDSKVISKCQENNTIINTEINARSTNMSDCKANIFPLNSEYSHDHSLPKKKSVDSPQSGVRSLLFQGGRSKRTWGSLLEEEQERYRQLLQPRSPDRDRDTSQSSTGPPHDWSDYSRPSPLDKIRSFKESAEQNLFDLLERKVDNSSFCSTSSFIARAVGATGTDTPTASRDYVHTFPHVLSLKPGLTDIKTMENLDSSRDSFVLKTDGSCENPKYDTDPGSSGDEYSESTDTEQSSLKSSLSQDISTSTPNQRQNRSKKNNLRDKVLKIMICQDSNASEFKIIQDENDSSARETTLIQSEDTGASVNMKSNKLKDLDLAAKAELLKARLRELQHEIDIFKNENESLAQMKSELEAEKENFFKQKAEAERKLNEDKIVSEYYLAEEKEKLTKQKLLYDRHIKDMKGNSAKKEREEIAFLKKELIDLKENAKVRDSKVGAAQSRLRNQIKVLESQNSELKMETNKLRKDNNRLRSANVRSQRLSNINSLAEINKSLAQFTLQSKMTDVDVEEVFPESKQEKRPNSGKNSTISKATVIKHKVAMQRSKSVPNLTPTSRYAKFFSQRDQECRKQKEQEGYGLYSDSSDDSILADTHIEHSHSSSHPHSIKDILSELPEVRDIAQERRSDSADYKFDSDSISRMSSLKRLSNIDNNEERIIEQMYAEKFEFGTNTENKSRSAEPSAVVEGRGKPLQDNSTDHVVIDRPDGSKEIRFTNGNTKIVSADESYSKFVYYNGDIKETFYIEGTIKYYYKEVNTHHTTYKDGSQVLQFPDGQMERRYPDGSVESVLSDGASRWGGPGGAQEWRFPDGTVMAVSAQGERTLRFPNGQVEVHTKDHKRREFPDGTVKVVYRDGTAETRYANGRVRLKDKAGHLLLDSSSSN